MTPRALAIREALERHEAVSDAELDHIFPEELRERSSQHWTPVDIAIRAGELLAPRPDARVLDVGSGVGKACIIGALVTGATWWGVEQDATLVAAASHAAWQLGVGDHTRFVHGDGSRMPWDDFDAFYFFNPFGTLLLAPHASPFVRYATIQNTLRRIHQRLIATPVGTRVVTYHGYGGPMPAGYTQVTSELTGSEALELWIREAPTPPTE
jgi:predicted RNA methylase